MIQKYRILERTWFDNKKDYVVQEYSKKWYSKKYKWRTAKQIMGSMSGFWKEPAIFSSREEAEEYIREYTNCIIDVQVVGKYYNIKSEEK